MNKVLITPRSLSRDGHYYFSKLKDAGLEVIMPFPGKQPSEEELLSVIPECVAYLAGVEKISPAVLDAAAGLKVISRNGVGKDNVDLDAAEKNGIEVTITVGANSRGVSELAVGLMLSGMRMIPATSSAIKGRGWSRWKGREVQGRTLGLVGCGQIGKYVAQMSIGLGMNVLAYDLYPDKNFNPGENFSYTSLDTIWAESDVISLHCPPGEKPLIDASVISSFEKTPLLVNTARAGLLDENAVLAALENGQVFGLATDVFNTEPPEDSPLIQHERTICSAHIGGFTNESVDRATIAAVDNILKVLG